jgi:hypothetical protein
LTERAETIARAIGKLCEMPPPPTAEQLAAVPRIVKMKP